MKTIKQTEGFVKCKECGEETVLITADATHTSSDCVEYDLNGYSASNSDASWKVKKGTEKFLCETCGHTWKVDGKVTWEWID